MNIAEQPRLFEPSPQLPPGPLYRSQFITEKEETKLMKMFKHLPFKNMQFKEYTAKRRVIHFGWGYDFEKEKLIPGPPLPAFLHPLQIRIAKWLDIQRKNIAEALISEYSRGTQIGWHRDREHFSMIVGISFGSTCHMRWRPAKVMLLKKYIISLELPHVRHTLCGTTYTGNGNTPSLPQEDSSAQLRFEI